MKILIIAAFVCLYIIGTLAQTYKIDLKNHNIQGMHKQNATVHAHKPHKQHAAHHAHHSHRAHKAHGAHHNHRAHKDHGAHHSHRVHQRQYISNGQSNNGAYLQNLAYQVQNAPSSPSGYHYNIGHRYKGGFKHNGGYHQIEGHHHREGYHHHRGGYTHRETFGHRETYYRPRRNQQQ